MLRKPKPNFWYYVKKIDPQAIFLIRKSCNPRRNMEIGYQEYGSIKQILFVVRPLLIIC